MPVYHDRQGAAVRLTHTLGVGGEGAVFEIHGVQDCVAKIYHRALDSEKAAKLAAMVELADPRILQFAAWPRSILYGNRNGAPIGLVIPRVTNAREIHELYSPAQRKVQFPHASWQFLVRVARNCAAAFDALHEVGIVVGDVNQGNVLVCNDALVRFIDCDSFQVSKGGQVFRCEVGVPHFTPPELQRANFRQVTRTENHDCFGLAVLIFHCLFQGRHPFAGRYNGPGDMPIERAIQEGRFAYGRAGLRRQMQPPPFAVVMDDLSGPIAHLFERAFGARERPAAAEWANTLGELERHLCRCKISPIHVYYSGNRTCPWCRISDAGGPDFFLNLTRTDNNSTAGGIDLDALWREIDRIDSPRRAIRSVISVHVAPARPAPLPIEGDSSLERLVGRTAAAAGLVAAIALPIGMLADLSGLIGVGCVSLPILLVFVVWWFVLRITSPISDELRRRRKKLRDLQAELERGKPQYDRAIAFYEMRFQDKLNELRRARDDARVATQRRDAEIVQLRKNVRQSQLNDHLRRCLICGASISGFGPARKAVLISYNIETAFDITPQSVSNVPGCGPFLTEKLLEWRRMCEQRFRFDPKGVSQAEVAAINAKYQQQISQGERVLRHGPSELQQIVSQAASGVESVRGVVERLQQQIAQAKADLELAESY